MIIPALFQKKVSIKKKVANPTANRAALGWAVIKIDISTKKTLLEKKILLMPVWY